MQLINEIEEQIKVDDLSVIKSNFKHILNNEYDEPAMNHSICFMLLICK
jgi:hypothetical protein